MSDPSREAARDWWRTEIIDIQPGAIRVRGYPIEQLIGAIDFPQMIWLMLRGELPSKAQSALFGAALVAAVDHGPQAPSIAIARMAMTCGVGINNAMASATNVLGDVHGGAGEQAMELYCRHRPARGRGRVPRRRDARGDRPLPGRAGQVRPGLRPSLPSGRSAGAAAAGTGRRGGEGGHRLRPLRRDRSRRRSRTRAPQAGKHLTMNIDGSAAVIFCELGFAPMLGRGIFILSRSVGILAHAWEQSQQGGRNKGPIPPQFLYTYAGPAPRDLKGE